MLYREGEVCCCVVSAWWWSVVGECKGVGLCCVYAAFFQATKTNKKYVERKDSERDREFENMVGKKKSSHPPPPAHNATSFGLAGASVTPSA